MKTGGDFHFKRIEWFNGGLFDSDAALPLEPEDIKLTLEFSRLDWSSIDPAILGTLFERGLARISDPSSALITPTAKRSCLSSIRSSSSR